MEKLNKKLGIYCLLNKETEKYDTFMMSYSDEEARDYFLDQTSNVAFELANKADTVNYNKLFNSLKDTCLLRVAQFNEEKGAFDNEQVVLLDLITRESIEDFIKAKFELQNKFKDIIPEKIERKEV